MSGIKTNKSSEQPACEERLREHIEELRKEIEKLCPLSLRSRMLWESIERAGKDETNALSELIESLSHEFYTAMQEDVKVYLPHSLLFLDYVIKAYTDSINRFLVYAWTDGADVHKKAAYIMKWIARIKPIQIKTDTVYLSQSPIPSVIYWINSYFAVHVAFAILFIEKFGTMWNEAYTFFCDNYPNIYQELVYRAQYRNISGRSVAAQLCTIEALVLCKFSLTQKLDK